MAFYSPYSWVDGTSPVNSVNLNHLEAGVAAAIPQTGNTSGDIMGYGLNGSTDVGFVTEVNVGVCSSGIELIHKVNNKNVSGTDVFINASTGALQLRFSATGIAARVSTNTPSVGGTITWGGDTFVYGH